MSLRSLIFTNADEDKKEGTEKAGVKSFKKKFPTTRVSISTDTPFAKTSASKSISEPITPDNPSCEPHLEKIMAMYEKGFDDLNQDGYDFYEYFKAVIQSGVNNPVVYTMALTMAKTMDSSVSKSLLLEQAEFYISEIEKVHKHYETQGSKKSQDVLRLKNSEESALQAELSEIDAEIARLTILKSTKESELSMIDGKYTPDITEVSCKLMANDIAKDSILGTIQKVIEGINKNI